MPARVEIVEVARGVFARMHEGLTNAGIILGDDSVLVVDSLRVPSFARDLIADVRRISSKPIRYVIDTHGHWDHAFGNEEFPDSTIIGHENCRREMEEIGEAWRDGVVARNNEWSEEVKTVDITPPNLTFQDRMALHYGGRRIDLIYLGRAHTSGDIFIHLPDDGIVFTGDAVQDGRVPYMLDGYPEEWVATDERLMEVPFERFVSGHGAIGEKAALDDARDLMAALVTGTRQALADGQDEATAARSVAAAMQGRFGHWPGFERIGDGVGRAYAQLRG